MSNFADAESNSNVLDRHDAVFQFVKITIEDRRRLSCYFDLSTPRHISMCAHLFSENVVLIPS